MTNHGASDVIRPNYRIGEVIASFDDSGDYNKTCCVITSNGVFGAPLTLIVSK
jgi:hypothetical protein